MEDKPIRHSLRSLGSFLLLCVAAGIFTGALIFLFKYTASLVIGLSGSLYGFVRENPTWLPALLGASVILGCVLALLLKFAPDCKGGGIPSSITILRGQVDFHWIKSIFVLFPCALITYLSGVPLGNEGPSVQMGTAAGRASVRLFAKNNPALDRYIMTGSASAGFAAATGAPISGIFFAFEEAHRRFSPMIFMASAVTVVASTATMQALCSLFGTSFSLFHFRIDTSLPLQYLWSALLIGLICALGTLLFSTAYKHIRRFLRGTLKSVSPIIKTVCIFVSVTLIGFFFSDALSTGHSLVDRLIEGGGIWYLLLLAFALRSLLLILANNADITGGLFVPTLALGAILGALCGKALITCGLLPQEHYVLCVVIGISSFMSAASRTPIIALTFAVEALSGFSNILPIALGVTLSYVLVEALGLPAFTDTVIEGKLEAVHEGKKSVNVDCVYTVAEGSFADGKELRDIFWPPTCTVLSIQKKGNRHHGQEMEAGDRLHLHYRSFTPSQTAAQLEALLGKQSELDSADGDSQEGEIPDL